jgi:phosphatidylserine/phosphatidylglycerophosphate/cardiolipin synthase-like enzyme
LNYASEIETFLTQTINETRSTLDIAAFEFDNPILTNAIINAYWRGVQIRIVTDNEHGLEDLETSMADFIEAGIGVVDDGRTAFMHNSFMILDGRAVWAGDSSFTVNSATRNNTSAIYIESEELAQLYTTEFEEMYLDQLFGPNSPENTQGLVFAGEIPLQVFFAPEDNVLDIISATLDTADRNLEFMMFSFTNDAVGQLMLSLAETRGIQVRGIVERTGSMNGELPDLVCSGLDVRTDGNPRFMNHKIILIDDETVLAMSSNLSTNAMTSNDENIMIFTSPEIVAQYRQEFETLWAIAELPQGVDCSALQN